MNRPRCDQCDVELRESDPRERCGLCWPCQEQERYEFEDAWADADFEWLQAPVTDEQEWR